MPVAEVDSHKSKLTLDTRFDEADEYVHFQVTGMDEIALIFFPKPDLRSRLESTTKRSTQAICTVVTCSTYNS